MIFALCGTSDARELAVRIQAAGHTVTTSVVTDSAAKSLQEAGLPVRVGRLTSDEMVEWVTRERVRLIVDASHPFAEEAHKNAMLAAKRAGIPYVRFERASSEMYEHPKLTIVDSYEAAAMKAKQRGGSIMLTTGSKTLPIFARELLTEPSVRLVARMLPRKDNMELCEELGVEQKNIIALQGPFTKELNEALYRQYETTLMITKESGKVGQVDEKVASALAMGIEVIVISRPNLDYGVVYSRYDDILSHLEQ
jgi:precorrin-6A/cobalt-precorrin-6A reductase